MYYIFNSNEKLVGWCDFEPSQEDLATRGEFSVHSDNYFENPLSVIVGKYKTLLEPAEVITDENLAIQLLTERDRLLKDTDWISSRHFEQKTLGVDTSISDKQFEECLAYRQCLRDVTKQEGFPHISLPDKPHFMGN